MAQTRFPLYLTSQTIYQSDGTVALPLALVERVHTTENARLLFNIYTQQQAWFPESILIFHWHVVSATELVMMLSIPQQWKKRKQEFFHQRSLL